MVEAATEILHRVSTDEDLDRLLIYFVWRDKEREEEKKKSPFSFFFCLFRPSNKPGAAFEKNHSGAERPAVTQAHVKGGHIVAGRNGYLYPPSKSPKK